MSRTFDFDSSQRKSPMAVSVNFVCWTENDEFYFVCLFFFFFVFLLFLMVFKRYDSSNDSSRVFDKSLRPLKKKRQ